MIVQRSDATKINLDGTINLPEDILQRMGWKEGDTLAILLLNGEQMILSRNPRDIAATYAGAFTDLYPDPEETRRFLDEGRGYTDDDSDSER